MAGWRTAWMLTVAWLGVGCVGGGGSAEPDGASGTSGCVECMPGCFDCGGGCQCVDGGVLPDASTWVSPFPETGDDGTWRDSPPRLCVGGQTNLQTIDVWSDSRGVYALIAGAVRAAQSPGAEAPEPAGAGGGTAGAGGVSGFGGFGGGGIGGVAGACSSNDCFGETILFNDGTQGWEHIYDEQEPANFSQRRMSGIPNGPLVVWGSVSRFQGGEACAFGRMDPSTGDWTCDRASGPPTTVFPVNESLAYGALDTDLIRFDGSQWSVHGPPAPAPIATLWANATDVAIIGVDGVVSVLRDGAWSPTGASGTVLWGNAIDDLWIATSFGTLVHYDGVTTTNLHELDILSCGQRPVISGIWGSGDTIYLYGPRTLLRWRGSSVETLGDWTCDFVQSASITRVWGNGPDEVFIALTDFNRPFTDPACGNGIVMYFDGTQFHSL